MTKEEILVELRKNLLYFRDSVLITEEDRIPLDNNTHLVNLLTLNEELKKVGYRLSDRCLLHMSDADLEFFHKILLPELYQALRMKFEPLYPGFPQQVLSADQEKLWKDQHELYETLDYNAFRADHPWYTADEISGPKALKVLEAMTVSDLYNIFTNLLKAPGFIAEGDFRILVQVLQVFPEFELPEAIPNKTLYALTLMFRLDVEARDINDILRLMALESSKRIEGKNIYPLYDNSDLSRYVKSPSRSKRLEMATRISKVLETKGIDNCVLDAKKYYSLWELFNKKYHFCEYKTKFPEVYTFMHTLLTPEERKTLTSWNSKLHKIYHTLNKDNFPGLLDFIVKRPGEFIRRFDSLIRKSVSYGLDPERVVDKIQDLDINTKLLLELLNYYDKRQSGAPRLIHDEAGNLMKSLPVLSPISGELSTYINFMICMKVYDNIRKFNKDGDIFKDEKVYLSSDLKRIPVPYNMKGSGNLVVRGTRIPIPEGTKAIRMFTRWIDEKGKEDLDLHSTFVDSNGRCDLIGWNSSYKEDYGIFSGDVRHRKGSCAEYTDINLETAKTKYKYVVSSLHNYERRPLNSLPAWIGYEFLDSYSRKLHSHYYPEDTDFLEKLEVPYSSMAAFMVDLEKMEIIILNTDLAAIPSSSGETAKAIVKFFQADPTFSVYNIVHAWYTARGAEIVETPEEATKVLGVKEIGDYSVVQSMLTL